MAEMKILGMNVMASDDVPEDEVWLCSRVLFEVVPQGEVIAVRKRYEIAGKIQLTQRGTNE